jgi:hypothetical protein
VHVTRCLGLYGWDAVTEARGAALNEQVVAHTS